MPFQRLPLTGSAVRVVEGKLQSPSSRGSLQLSATGSRVDVPPSVDAAPRSAGCTSSNTEPGGRNASLESNLMSQPLGNQRSVQRTRRSPTWRLRRHRKLTERELERLIADLVQSNKYKCTDQCAETNRLSVPPSDEPDCLATDLARATGLDLFNLRFPCWHQSRGD